MSGKTSKSKEGKKPENKGNTNFSLLFPQDAAQVPALTRHPKNIPIYPPWVFPEKTHKFIKLNFFCIKIKAKQTLTIVMISSNII
jgi:hypothetical protein